jgi:hypothetical protein
VCLVGRHLSVIILTLPPELRKSRWVVWLSEVEKGLDVLDSSVELLYPSGEMVEISRGDSLVEPSMSIWKMA